MEKRDNLIETGVSTIEKKIEELKKPNENYKFQTNCKFGEINIKTVGLGILCNCLVEIQNRKDALDKVYQKLENVLETGDMRYEKYGFKLKEWEDDICYIIEKIKYNEKLNNLKGKANELKKYYSNDKQADIAVQNILNTI